MRKGLLLALWITAAACNQKPTPNDTGTARPSTTGTTATETGGGAPVTTSSQTTSTTGTTTTH